MSLVFKKGAMINAGHTADLTEKLPAAAFGFDTIQKFENFWGLVFGAIPKMVDKSEKLNITPLNTNKIMAAYKAAVGATALYISELEQIVLEMDSTFSSHDSCNKKAVAAAENMRRGLLECTRTIAITLPQNSPVRSEIAKVICDLLGEPAREQITFLPIHKGCSTELVS